MQGQLDMGRNLRLAEVFKWRMNVSRAFACDRRVNPAYMEWPHYLFWETVLPAFFPHPLATMICIAPQSRFKTQYLDYDGFGKRDKSYLPDFAAFALANQDDRPPASTTKSPYPQGLTLLDHTISTVVMLVEIKPFKGTKQDREANAQLNKPGPDIDVVQGSGSLPGVEDGGKGLSSTQNSEECENDSGSQDTFPAVQRLAKEDSASSGQGQPCIGAEMNNAQRQVVEQAQYAFASWGNTKKFPGSPSSLSPGVVILACVGAHWKWSILFREFTVPASPMKDGDYLPPSEVPKMKTVKSIDTLIKMHSARLQELKEYEPGQGHARTETSPTYVQPVWSPTLLFGTPESDAQQERIKLELDKMFPLQKEHALEAIRRMEQAVAKQELAAQKATGKKAAKQKAPAQQKVAAGTKEHKGPK
ncbi:hypothetical protein C8Q77DRAFT_758697 [Trametes polyzona]|nr:hypothetical protein C8Q77DRAFT_758697 [Trametes polyzona]